MRKGMHQSAPYIAKQYIGGRALAARLRARPGSAHNCSHHLPQVNTQPVKESKSGRATGESDLSTQGLPTACRAELAETLNLRLGDCHPLAPASDCNHCASV